jgi:hypothetical protein
MVFDKKNKLLAIGRNSFLKTHPLQAKAAKAVGEPARVYLHAEIAALVKIKDWSKAHKIVVSRFNNEGKPMLAKPCKCCMHIINQTDIKYVEYT